MKVGLKKALICSVLILLLAGGYISVCFDHNLRPIDPEINNASLTSVDSTGNISWPVQGQAAVGILGTNVLDTNGSQVPAPTASTAKLITALMILKARPLSLGEQGPTVTLGPSDVSIYNTYVSEQGSVVQVVSGEHISEYQMLEAMLLPSANNMADSLAIWAYGSLSAYSTAANQYVQSLGLSGTHIGADASGYDPSTTSTAEDLVKIGEVVMNNPVLAQIVAMPSVTGIPETASITNVNHLLGTDNVVGIKTGNTDQAGGVFVGAVKTTFDNKPVTIVTADVGAPTLAAALSDSVPLLSSVQKNFDSETVIKAGTVLASYQVPWDNQTIKAVTKQNLVVDNWGGAPVNIDKPVLNSLKYSAQDNQIVGSISVSGNGLIGGYAPTPLVLDGHINKPSLGWSLTHPKI